nr:hypothetical protein [Tanacetum cinerariifolium]
GPLVHELILEFFSTFKFGKAVLELDTARALQFLLGSVRRRMSWRDFILALGLHIAEEMQTPGFGLYWADSATQISDKEGSMLRFCHRLIACSIAERSQAPKKVIVIDLFYLRRMDVDSVNVPYLLVERQQVATAGALEFAEDVPLVDEGAQAFPAPIQAPQPPSAARSMPQRMAMIEEDVREIRGALGEQREENLKLTVEEQVILEEPTSSTGTLSSLQHHAKDFSFGDLFFNDKPSEAENEKTTAETEAELMVSVTIQQDTSAIPPMTTPVIDLTSRTDSPNVHRPLQATATETTTTATTTHLPPPQPQQSTTDSMLIKRIGELEQIMANLIQDNKHLEERLDGHGARLYTLENLDIPPQVSKAVDEIVIDAVDWAIQASLWNRFRDLPEANMKEILHQ